MLNSDLIRQLDESDKPTGLVLVEFPKEGGPYRSPGDLVPLIGTSDTIIETVYPRNHMAVHDLFVELTEHPLDGRVQLFLNQGGSHPVAYYDIGAIRLNERGVVLVAGGIIAT